MDFNKIYDTIYIGATVPAIAAVLTRPNGLIIDSRGLAAREFSATLRHGETVGEAITEAGRAFREELTKRRILTDDGFNPSALTPVLSKMLTDSGSEVLFMTRVISVRRENGRYRLEIVYLGSVYAVEARRLVDTTPSFELRSFFTTAEISGTSRLNAAVTSGNGYFSVPADTPDIARAREILYGAWDEIPDGRLLLTASEQDFLPDRTDLCPVWHPAVSSDPVSAFDEGVQMALENDAPTAEPIAPVMRDEGEVDVVIVGLGTAGAIAAVTAGKRGLRTLGIEILGCVGGTGTVGGVPGYYYGYHGGLYMEIDRESQALAEEERLSGTQAKTAVLERYFREYGIRTVFGGTVYAVLREENRIIGLRWCDNDGLHEVRCAYAIDCTAESAVCIAAGCEMLGGRESDGCYQPYSHVAWSDNALCVNLDDGVVDSYDPFAYGNAVLRSSSSFIHLWDSYRGGRFLGTAPLLGLREGKKILGEEIVSFADFLAGKTVDKPVYFGLSNLDNHAKDSAFESRAYRDWNTICNMWSINVGIPVPAGALIPKGYTGLLAAGRNLSVDHDFATGLRMKDDVQKSGEAAATLAALSIRIGIPATEVPYERLKTELTASGCLGKNDRVTVMRQTNGGGANPEPVNGGNWDCDDIGVLLDGLRSPHPGYFLWKAGNYHGADAGKLEQSLLDGMNGATPYFRENCTLALALRNSPACTKSLLERILDTSGRYPENSWTHNHLYAVSAISAAGRMGLEEALDPLLTILTDPSHAEKIPVPPRKTGGYDFMLTTADVHFQLFTHALVAVGEILEKHPARRAEIGKIVRSITDAPGFAMTVSFVTREDLRLDMTETARKYAEKL